jgi:hypothetical protein
MLRLTRWRIIDTFRKRLPQNAAPANGDGTATSPLERIPDESSLNLDVIWDEEWEIPSFVVHLVFLHCQNRERPL